MHNSQLLVCNRRTIPIKCGKYVVGNNWIVKTYISEWSQNECWFAKNNWIALWLLVKLSNSHQQEWCQKKSCFRRRSFICTMCTDYKNCFLFYFAVTSTDEFFTIRTATHIKQVNCNLCPQTFNTRGSYRVISHSRH